ncbi:MAG TPA: HEAT repeat domain-containing protein [Thermoanaerobaculia bacterium]|nr:HEAT repeat domain-containing protein [Thermoanaerobaculia bacterium]
MNRIASSVLVLMLVTSPAFAVAGAPEKHKEKERKAKSMEREADLYDEGTDALDEKDWTRAARLFRQVARLQGEHADASLYWLSRAQNELGQRAEALATLLELEKAFPKSHWAEDGKALEVEIRQSSGQHVEPEQFTDEDVKLMALNGLMGSDPEKALPILEKIISGNGSPRVKERAIFVLSQSHSPRAIEVLGRVARDSARPDLQQKAVRYLGIMGGEESRKVLADVYASTNDIKIKRSILKSYMIAGDRSRLLALAKGEPIVELRGDAVRQLGIIGARNELADLYNTETSVEIRKRIIQAMFIGGSADKLADIARNEKVPELRATAIRNLGLMGNARTGDLLVSLYESDSSLEVRHSVIQGLFLQQNAKALIGLARKEKNPELKRDIISKLALIRSDEVSNYLMEVLKD